ncbi:MAG: hypothetical protein ACI8U0_002849, partial [Flavobacteriales bacterium]
VTIAVNSETIIGRKSHHRNGPMIAKPDHKVKSKSLELPGKNTGVTL